MSEGDEQSINKKIMTSAINGMTIPETRHVLVEIRDKWACHGVGIGKKPFYMTDALESTGGTTNAQRFSTEYLQGQIEKRSQKPRRHDKD